MTGTRAGSDAASLLKAVRDRDPLAIARAITAIENRTAVGTELAVAVRGRASRCRTLGVTGPPGAGKSSLINALLPELLPRYRRVAILTVDPSSPISGGAVLGDRVRMAAHSANPDVLIRSLAARGHLGGVTRTTRSVMDLLAAADMDLVIVETVGTGQSEVEVANLTDVKIVVCAPGLGDEMQAMKAGVLEIADLLVVNKADLPDAARTATHLTAMLHHRGHEERRSMLSVSTQTRDGLKALGETCIKPLPGRGAAHLARQDLEEDETLVPAAGLVVGVIDERTGRQDLEDLEFILRRHLEHLHQGLVVEGAELLQVCVAHPLAQGDTGQRHGVTSSRGGR